MNKFAWTLSSIRKQDKNFPYTNESLNTTKKVLKFVEHLNHLDVECFSVLYLDNKRKLIGITTHEGTTDQVRVYPREIAKHVLLSGGCTSVILVHNHPSDIKEPSVGDITITDHIKKTLDLFGVELVDHIILCKSGSYSFVDKNLM